MKGEGRARMMRIKVEKVRTLYPNKIVGRRGTTPDSFGQFYPAGKAYTACKPYPAIPTDCGSCKEVFKESQ